MILDRIRGLGCEAAPTVCVQFLETKKLFGFPKETFNLDHKEFNEADYFIAEATGRSFTIGYFYALALARKMPILLLVKDENYGKDLPSGAVLGIENELVRVEYYSEKTITPILKKFLSTKGKQALTKFNFIISPHIGDYLEWVAHVKKQPKSDYLRKKIISEIIEKDEEYLEYIRKQEEKAWKP